MSEIPTGNALDKEMLAKAGRNWLALVPYNEDSPEWVIIIRYREGACDYLVVRGDGITHVARHHITALHAPTDNPQMPTAYLLNSSDTITLDEVKKFVHGGYSRGWTKYSDLSGFYNPNKNAHDQSMPPGNWSHTPEVGEIWKSPGGNIRKIIESEAQ